MPSLGLALSIDIYWNLGLNRVTYSCISLFCLVDHTHSLLRQSLVDFWAVSLRCTSFVSPVCIILIKLKIWLYSVDKEKGKHTHSVSEWGERERKMMLIFADWVETKYTDRAPPHHIHYTQHGGLFARGGGCSVWRFETWRRLIRLLRQPMHLFEHS